MDISKFVILSNIVSQLKKKEKIITKRTEKETGHNLAFGSTAQLVIRPCYWTLVTC